ncbi:MAG: DUF4355 domain-containing protein [Ruminiclostridium sp.]|nr:DUF4355 domain-containing protein [Ruminiclostridium sp.]
MAEIKNNAEKNGKPAEVKEELFTKAQVDELMGKERESWQAKLKEAEKLAQMDAQQKNDYRRKQAETALAEREAAVSKRELMADAAERLTEYKLPKSLISCVNLSSAEECERSIEGLKAAFSEAVSVAVNERIRGSAPKSMAANGSDAFLDGLCK